MPFELEHRLVIGVASSALFDLSESDAVFHERGEAGYRVYQAEHLDDHLTGGVAFPFVKRLLSLNDLSPSSEDPLVEVIVLSKNDPMTGLRVMRSIEHHGLRITRAIFTQGQSPYPYIPALGITLFLSANSEDVRAATAAGYPAGLVLDSPSSDESDDPELRIAFDFDGVVVDDESESVMQTGGLEEFRDHERANAITPHNQGPLAPLLLRLSAIQRIEEDRVASDETYSRRIRISIVTARDAPAHERAVTTLKSWDVAVNDAFFLGGIDKGRVLAVLRPHIFFDDQRTHLTSSSRFVPSVHVPFGKLNRLAESETVEDSKALVIGPPLTVSESIDGPGLIESGDVNATAVGRGGSRSTTGR
ncbi:5'-nucleotidase [Prescottella equi]|uniref:5'-nucleotidase n=1 Tax=Rhodococcus hoagii TaxID=43767 RepID=A0A9Q5WQH0_RHOHA|nr:5'-nucleotidase [Prescottella equi]MBM4487182.1 5'-nucleotidase [Prescottella equi]MBM4499916.1 5'-nucleotidase [Prescottella equi]MBM4505100.1 5'-nucleotidase [Prescottella equi]MBM4509139.1 5'-nucleotidase [Prescottella equi]MBM4552302.1 5'-nucleotidase [Prescottella equi]